MPDYISGGIQKGICILDRATGFGSISLYFDVDILAFWKTFDVHILGFRKCFDVGLLRFSKIWLLFAQTFWQHWSASIICFLLQLCQKHGCPQGGQKRPLPYPGFQKLCFGKSLRF